MVHVTNNNAGLQFLDVLPSTCLNMLVHFASCDVTKGTNTFPKLVPRKILSVRIVLLLLNYPLNNLKVQQSSSWSTKFKLSFCWRL